MLRHIDMGTATANQKNEKHQGQTEKLLHQISPH
jgi:hypothetical protein